MTAAAWLAVLALVALAAVKTYRRVTRAAEARGELRERERARLAAACATCRVTPEALAQLDRLGRVEATVMREAAVIEAERRWDRAREADRQARLQREVDEALERRWPRAYAAEVDGEEAA